AAERSNRPALPMIRRADRGDFSLSQRHHSRAARANPQIPLAILADGTDPVLGKAVRAIELQQLVLSRDQKEAGIYGSARNGPASRLDELAQAGKPPRSSSQVFCPLTVLPFAQLPLASNPNAAVSAGANALHIGVRRLAWKFHRHRLRMFQA